MTASSRRNSIPALLAKAVVLHQAGKLADAELLYDKVLKLDRANVDALNLKGVITNDGGNPSSALVLFDRAISGLPSQPEFHFNRGLALAALERNPEALNSYDQAIRLKPHWTDPRLNAGILLHKMGRIADAITFFRALLQLSPNDMRALYNLGACLEKSLAAAKPSEREAISEESRAAFERALMLDPNNPDTHYALANLHTFRGEYRQAIDRLETALRFKPNWSDAWNNLATQREAIGDRAGAIAAFDQALKLEPANTGPIVNRGMTYLAVARLAEGWDSFARRAEDARFPSAHRDWPWPLWQGEDLAGKSILVWADQGIGDEVLYGSMIPDIAARAATCVVECAPRLVPLYRRSFPALDVFANDPSGKSALLQRSFDFQSSVIDLGRHLRRSMTAFSNRRSFLKADDDQIRMLRSRYLAAAPDNRLVGISWRSIAPGMDHQKSLPLTDFQPLLKVPGLTFINLQYGDVAADVANLDRQTGSRIVVDPSIDSLADLDSFAAQISALDAVVSVSNTAAHMAGALGVPTLVHVPDGRKRLWYWFTDGDYSPWYRSLRIYRRAAPSGIADIAETISAALR
jgi:tetratricopeptide (TPR) repeat protein